jgi:hypothetical protein
MDGFNQVGIARQGLQRRRLVSPQERGHVVLLCLQSRKLEPRERVFEVAPDAFNGAQLGTVWGQEHQADVRGGAELLGCMRATVVQEQEIQAVGEGLREGVDEELKAVSVQIRQLEEEARARGRLDRAIDVEPLKDMLHRADGLYPPGGETAAADSQQAEAAFVLTKDPDGAVVLQGDETLELLMTGRLKRLQRLRVFLCGSAVGP